VCGFLSPETQGVWKQDPKKVSELTFYIET